MAAEAAMIAGFSSVIHPDAVQGVPLGCTVVGTDRQGAGPGPGVPMAVDRSELAYKMAWVQSNLDLLSSEAWAQLQQAERAIVGVRDDGKTVAVNLRDVDEDACRVLDQTCNRIAAETGMDWTNYVEDGDGVRNYGPTEAQQLMLIAMLESTLESFTTHAGSLSPQSRRRSVVLLRDAIAKTEATL